MNFIACTILLCSTVAVSQPIVWDNFDACSGTWTQSSAVGTKGSFRPAKFLSVAPQSQQGGCYLSYTSVDTFHAGSTVGWFAQQKVQAWTKRWVNMMVYSRDGGVR